MKNNQPEEMDRAALRAGDERLRLFFERQSVGMAITSPEKGWLRVNRKMCDMLGYTAQELMAMSWADVTHPDDLAPDVAQFQRMLKGEIDSYAIEKRYIRKDGGIVHVALSIGCVRKPDGVVDYVLALIEDVTERKHMEEELRQREKEARTLIEHSPDTIARYDRDCRRTFVNLAFAATVDGGAAALLGKTPTECPGSPKAGIYEEKIKSVLAAGKADDFELAWRTGEKEVCSHIRLIPEFDEGGKVESVLAVGRDISERKRYEAELRKTKNVLRERNAELQAYKTQLEQRVAEQVAELRAEIADRERAERELEASRMQLRREVAQREEMREEERKRLAREVHDELGQILTGLKLHVSILNRICSTETNPLCGHVHEIEELTDQAMNVARNIAVVLRPVEAEMGIVPALQLQANRFSAVTGIQCKCELPDEELQLNERCTTAFYRIVQELLTNVARHAQADEVRIALRRDGENYVACVRDNGTGFDLGAVRRDAFGLAGIRERVMMLGGSVEIESKTGKGTEVAVHIPAEVCHD